jgi:hypothetical protein
MKLDIGINNEQQKTVEFAPKSGTITVNNKAHLFEQVETGNKHFTVLINNKSIDVFVLKFDKEAKTANLLVNGKKCSISASDEMDNLLKKLGMDKGTAKKMKEPYRKI